MTAIYARQSVDKGEQSLSIESQIEECRKRLTAGEFEKVYKDKGYSGANINRPDFTKLMKDVKSGVVNKIIVWKLDRISRSLLDFANIVSTLEDYKVTLDIVTEQFNTSTPIGKAMLNIVMVFAQLERETIQLRVADNYVKRAKRGFFLGGPAAFGLVKKSISVNGYKTSTFELCPMYGDTLLLIFEKYANTDISLGKLAQYLNENGHETQNGTKWESQKLSRILHSPTYVASNPDVFSYYKAKGVNILSPVDDFDGNGLYLFGRRQGNERKYTNLKDHSLVVALHKGFIDAHTWLRVQYKLDSNVQLKNSGKGQYTWLSGLVKCGYCGYAMTGQKTGDKVILRCSRRINFKDCNAGNTNAQAVENQVWSILLIKVNELQGTELVHENKNTANVNKLKTELIKVEDQIDRLVDSITDGSALKSVTRRIAELEAAQSELVTQIQKESLTSPSFVGTAEILELVKENLSDDEKREVARAIVKKVHVIDGKYPVVEWLF